MKQKQYLLYRKQTVGRVSGTASADRHSYFLGASINVINGAPVVSVVFEQTADGGFTWTTLATIILDTTSTMLETSSQIVVEGNAVRATLQSVVGGVADVNAWIA